VSRDKKEVVKPMFLATIKYKEQKLQLVDKVSFFDKTNDITIVDTPRKAETDKNSYQLHDR